MKYDGYRVLIAVGGGEARAYTRSGLDWSEKFAGIVEAAPRLKVGSALTTARPSCWKRTVDPASKPCRARSRVRPQASNYAFDLLELDGEDLTGLPLTARKEKLRAIIPDSDDRLRFSEHIVGSGEKLLHTFCDAGLEGVVSKLATGKYVGSRSVDGSR